MGCGASREGLQGRPLDREETPDQQLGGTDIAKLLSQQDSVIRPLSGIRRALLVGVTYEGTDSSEAQDFKGAANDLYRLRDTLIHEYNWDSSYITVLEDQGHLTPEPTRRNVLSRLESLVDDTHPGDLALIYFSCACLQEEKEGFSILPSDFYPNKSASSLISSRDLLALLARFWQGSSAVLLLDAGLSRSHDIIDLGYELSFDVAPSAANVHLDEYHSSEWVASKALSLVSQGVGKPRASVSLVVTTRPAELAFAADPEDKWRAATYPDPSGRVTPGSVFAAALVEALDALDNHSRVGQKNLKALMLDINSRLAFQRCPQRAALFTSSKQVVDVSFTL